MKIKLIVEQIENALKTVNMAVPSQTPKPILRSVRLQTKNKKLYLSATDLEVAVCVKVPAAQVKENIDLAIPADKLAAIIKEDPAEALEVKIKADSCEITGSDSRYTVMTYRTEDLPATVDVTGSISFEIKLGELQAAIKKVIFATGKETGFIMSGILWELDVKNLRMVCTDGRRLALCDTKIKGKKTEIRPLVPKKVLKIIAHLDVDADKPVLVKINERNISFKCEHITVTSSLLEGPFPKYQDIVPADYKKVIRLSTVAALKAIRRAAIFTDAESNAIKLSVSKNKVTISARLAECGDCEIDMQAEYKAELVEVCFNARFLTDGLGAIDDDQFDLALGGADSPGLLTMGDNYKYVIMPIQI